MHTLPLGHSQGQSKSPLDVGLQDSEGEGEHVQHPEYLRDIRAEEVLRWIDNNGGVEAAHKRNKDKADMIYSAIDSSSFWTPHAEQGSRSIMNATFRIADESLLGRFIAEAEELGLKGLRGHRIVGASEQACTTDSIWAALRG